MGDEKAMAAFEASLKAFSVLSFRGAEEVSGVGCVVVVWVRLD